MVAPDARHQTEIVANAADGKIHAVAAFAWSTTRTLEAMRTRLRG
jgi:hypothetical protein